MQAQYVTITLNAPFDGKMYENLDKNSWTKHVVAIRDRSGGFLDITAKGDREHAIIRFRNVTADHTFDYKVFQKRLARLLLRSLPHYASMAILDMKLITVQVSAIHDPTTTLGPKVIDFSPEVCNGIAQWFAKLFPSAAVTPKIETLKDTTS